MIPPECFKQSNICSDYNQNHLEIEINTRGLTANENEQSKFIHAYFKKQFSKGRVEVKKIKPTSTKQPFTQGKYVRLSTF